MVELSVLQILCWLLIGLVLILYACTAGFDLGATLILPFLKKEEDKRALLNIVGPTWDGNQTWIVFAGGALFVIWPVVYGLIFSGLYAVMLFILWSFFLRPPGFDYRHHIHNPRWKRSWEWALFISALFPVLMFGLVFGNLMLGLPFYFDAFSLRDTMEGNFFNLLNHFSLVCALISLLMVLSHGASLLHRRSEGELKAKFAALYRFYTALLLMSITAAALMVTYSVPGYILIASPAHPLEMPLDNVVIQSVGAWTASYAHYPWKIIGPLLSYFGFITGLITLTRGRGTLSFWANCAGITGLVLTAGFNLFPFIVPSSLKPAQSLTVWNASASTYTLSAMLWVGLVTLVLVFIYKMFTYISLWRKTPTLTAYDIQQHEHHLY